MELFAQDNRTRAQLSVRRVIIRKLKGIPTLNLPADVPAWRHGVPEIVALGGDGTRAKVALFDVIFRALEVLRKRSTSIAPELGNSHTQIRLDFEQQLPDQAPRRVRYLQGDDDFLAAHASPDSYGFRRHCGRYHPFIQGGADALSRQLHGWLPGVLPSLVYFPSAARDRDLQDDPADVFSHRRDRATFAHRWRPPRDWSEPVEYLASTLMDSDFEGCGAPRPIRRTFDMYAEELDAFTGGLLNLKWKDSTLALDASGVSLPTSALSRAERRAMVLAAELRRRWHPGSLVLIDEPDLELHPAWQTLIYQRVQALQRERGGQVWIATRSPHLFQLIDASSRGVLPADTPQAATQRDQHPLLSWSRWRAAQS